MTQLNETHDPHLKSWHASANAEGCDFSIQNLPFCVFRQRGSAGPFRGGVAIGDAIVDLAALARKKLFSGIAQSAVEAGAQPKLNTLMAMGEAAWSALRLELSRALRIGARHKTDMCACLVAQAEAEHDLPAIIGDFTDFYSSIHHATNVGKLFRPDSPLLPNYKWMPIAYHGRSSSVDVSEQSFHRPNGQILPPGATMPVVQPSRRLDYEMELGVFIGVGNDSGNSITIGAADSHVFGLCLLNDWSARDIQAWEYQPLGPFLGKNFATTLSPWIVTLEALAPFRCQWKRPAGDPHPLPYLDSEANRMTGMFDIQVQVLIKTKAMRSSGDDAVQLSLSSFRHAYWTIAQMVAHHTLNGCNLRPGDLLGTGTLSGPEGSEMGSLLELSYGGAAPVTLPNGEARNFLEDGDAVIMKGWCERAGAVRIGFGAASGVVLPARPLPPAS